MICAICRKPIDTVREHWARNATGATFHTTPCPLPEKPVTPVTLPKERELSYPRGEKK